MVHLEKVTSKNQEEIIEMDIFESQYPFVADNVESLADAYIAITSDDAYAYPFAIYDDDTPVGGPDAGIPGYKIRRSHHATDNEYLTGYTA